MVAYPFSSGSSWLRNWTGVSCIARGFSTNCAIREALYAEYIMQNAGLDEAQAGIKIAGRNINNHKYVPPLWQKGKRNWGTSWWEWKKRVKKLDKTQHSQNKDPIQSHHFMENNEETMETVTDFIFGGLLNHCRWWLQPWNWKMLAAWKKAMTNLDSIFKSRDILCQQRFV